MVEAIAVSSDGLLMAMSAVKDRANAERLAAVVSGMTSLAGGAAASYASAAQPGHRRHGRRLPALTAISSGSVLGVIADPRRTWAPSPTR